MTDHATALKQQAGEQAASLVQSGMVLGLGTGSTAIFAIGRVAARLRDGDLSEILAIATSRATEAAARALGIPMLTDDIPREIDLTIDGADEVDPALNLIKGGGALLREKIVAQATGADVALSLALYVVVYLIMFPTGIGFMAGIVRRGVAAATATPPPIEAGRPIPGYVVPTPAATPAGE